MGVCRTVLQIVTVFQTKTFHFSHPFSDLASKKLCHHFLDSTPTKDISYLHNYFSLFSYTFGNKTINTFIHSRSFLKNHTRFQTKMHGQSVCPFSDQYGAKIIPFGAAHTFMTYIKDYTPGGGGIRSDLKCSRRNTKMDCRKSPTRQELMLASLLSDVRRDFLCILYLIRIPYLAFKYSL